MLSGHSPGASLGKGVPELSTECWWENECGSCVGNVSPAWPHCEPEFPKPQSCGPHPNKIRMPGKKEMETGEGHHGWLDSMAHSGTNSFPQQVQVQIQGRILPFPQACTIQEACLCIVEGSSRPKEPSKSTKNDREARPPKAKTGTLCSWSRRMCDSYMVSMATFY